MPIAVANNFPKVFKKRHGTTNKGDDYEDLLTAFLAFKLTVDDEIEDFNISSNDDAFGSFDDIALELKYKTGRSSSTVVQLKHKQNTTTRITKDMLAGDKGDFSLQKYFQSYENIKQKLGRTSRCVLLTNAVFELPPKGFKFKLKNKDIDVTVLKYDLTSPEEHLLNTFQESYVYKFEFEDKNGAVASSYENFSQNFYLYANQKKFDDLKDCFVEEFKDECVCKEAAEIYLDYVKRWSEHEGFKERLSKSDVKAKIGEILLKPLMKVAANASTHPRLNLLDEISAVFDVVLIDGQFEVKLEEIYNPLKLNYQNDILKCGKKLYIIPQNVTDVNTLDINEVAFILWHLNKSPLFIEAKETNLAVLYKVMNLFEANERRVVLCGCVEKINKQEMSKLKIFQNLGDLASNQQVYTDIIKNTKVSLQGREEVLLENNEHFCKNVTSSSLFKSGVIKFGEEKYSDLPEPYIDQLLSRKMISSQFLIQHYIHSVPIISCNKKRITLTVNAKVILVETFLEENDGRKIDNLLRNRLILISQDQCTAEQFEAVSKRCKNKICHLFSVVDQQHLEWIRSNGGISEIQRFVDKEEPTIQESEIFSESKNKINIICGKPGAGKSVMMKYLKNTIPSDFWIVKINMSEHLSFFKNQPVDSNFVEYLLSFQKESLKYDAATIRVRRKFKKKKKIVFLLDGLDEVSVCLHVVIKKIKQLSEMGFICWATTRDHLQIVLEEAFNVLALTIREMDRSHQISYITRHLKSKLDSDTLKTVIDKIIRMIELTKDVAFLGVPMRIAMLTELFFRDAQKYKDLLDNMFTLTDLIHHFIEEKFRFCYENKGKFCVENQFTETILKGYRHLRIVQYKILALKSIVPREIYTKFNVSYEKLLLQNLDDGDEFGVIMKVDVKNNTAKFVHNVFGEFFVASWMVENMDFGDIFREFIFEENYRSVRIMFDLMLAKDRPAHIAVLCQDYKSLCTYKHELNSEDSAGRSPLHLACSWGQRRPLFKLDETDKNVWVLRNTEVKHTLKEDREALGKILRFLLEKAKCDPFKPDNFLKQNCIQYADNTLSLYVLEVLLEKHDIKFESLNNFKDLHSVTFYSILFNYERIFENLEKIFYICDEQENTLLHVAVMKQRYHFLDKILQNSLYITNIDKTNRIKYFALDNVRKANILIELKETPLHLAVRTENPGIVNFLIRNGANVDTGNPVSTALHIAAFQKNLNITRILLENGADVNLQDNAADTSLHFIVALKDVELVKLASKQKMYLNKNLNNKSPLDIAVENNSIEILEILMKNGIPRNPLTLSDYLFEAFIHAIKSGSHSKTLQWFLRNGIDLNKLDSQGCPPLHYAAVRGNLDTFQLLLKSPGVDVNLKFGNGLNLLISGVAGSNLEIVKILLRKKVDIKGNYGINSLITPVQKGNEDILKLLLAKQIDIDKRSKFGFTALHTAASVKNSTKILRLMLEQRPNANVNVRDDARETPLHWAALLNNLEMVKILRNKGAIMTLKNKKGFTPEMFLKLDQQKRQQEINTRTLNLATQAILPAVADALRRAFSNINLTAETRVLA